LLTTHLLDEAERPCQRIGLKKNGSIVAEGSLEELQKLIPAQEIIVVKTDQEAEVIAALNNTVSSPAATVAI
jgi:ABC-2 type transport system ATP-binding protein